MCVSARMLRHGSSENEAGVSKASYLKRLTQRTVSFTIGRVDPKGCIIYTRSSRNDIIDGPMAGYSRVTGVNWVSTQANSGISWQTRTIIEQL